MNFGTLVCRVYLCVRVLELTRSNIMYTKLLWMQLCVFVEVTWTRGTVHATERAHVKTKCYGMMPSI